MHVAPGKADEPNAGACVLLCLQLCFHVPNAARDAGPVCWVPHHPYSQEAPLFAPLAGHGA